MEFWEPIIRSAERGGQTQRHVHEIVGSTDPAGCGCCRHNHRFATVSGEAISMGSDDHVHEIHFHTDFYDEHYHEFVGRSGGAIDVGDGRHVHFANAETRPQDGHQHEFRVAALINDPTGD